MVAGVSGITTKTDEILEILPTISRRMAMEALREANNNVNYAADLILDKPPPEKVPEPPHVHGPVIDLDSDDSGIILRINVEKKKKNNRT